MRAIITLLGLVAGCTPVLDSYRYVEPEPVSQASRAPPTCKAVNGSENGWNYARGTEYTMTLKNLDTWCSIVLSSNMEATPTILEAIKIDSPPTHGKVRWRNFNGRTYIGYRPFHGYVGDDAFAFRPVPGFGYVPVAIHVLP